AACWTKPHCAPCPKPSACNGKPTPLQVQRFGTLQAACWTKPHCAPCPKPSACNGKPTPLQVQRFGTL
ncbi:hypothetical protein, partial [Aquitalea magnusonii]|uniref:hypothetical protein n=1 Tax=Aquitalea magnusonii TaxID=332411 RepID=UPI00195DBB32